jgi:uncharacterized protein DUF1302
MTNSRLWPMVLGAVVASWLAGAPRWADATLRWGDLQLSGNVQSQNLVRTPDPSTWEFVQNRNSARIRLDYDWLTAGKWITKYNIPFVESSSIHVLWRGVYDSIYDTTPGFLTKEDIHGKNYPAPPGFDGPVDIFTYATQTGIPNAVPNKNGQIPAFRRLTIDNLNLNSLGRDALDTLKFENELREMYIDLKFRGVPLSIRGGRQQVVWGETDNFRMLDRINALNLTWHFQQEVPGPAFGWDEIRRPYWMLKFLYDLGNIWKISQSFLEWYWNPGDWDPAKQTYLPRPWGLPFYNSLTNPVDGAFYDGPCGQFSPFTQGRGPRRGQKHCIGLLNNTKLFGRGNYSHNPMENSQVGVRFHGIAPFGMEFTLNYFYQRFGGDDGTNYAPLRVLLRDPLNPKRDAKITAQAQELFQRGIFPAEAFNDYVHTIGVSANYSDERFTQAVFRMEMIYDVGVPFFDLQKVGVIDTPALPGVTKKDMWKGMIAFDRPTWVRWLNKKSTWFLTGQFFWHYLVDNPSCRAQDVAIKTPQQRAAGGSCLVGGLDLPSSVRGSNVSFRDKIRDWEALFTLAAFSFYRGGSIVPTLGMAVDPVNQWNVEAFWAVDYVVRDDFVVNLAQRYYITPRGYSPPIFETWGVSGLLRGRSETSLRLTYQF